MNKDLCVLKRDIPPTSIISLGTGLYTQPCVSACEVFSACTVFRRVNDTSTEARLMPGSKVQVYKEFPDSCPISGIKTPEISQNISWYIYNNSNTKMSNKGGKGCQHIFMFLCSNHTLTKPGQESHILNII